MDPQQSHSASTAETSHQPGTPRIGRHARPASATSPAIPDLLLDRRTAERIAVRERSLADASTRLRSVGVDLGSLSTTVLAVAHDCLNLAKELARDRQELLIAYCEWEANRRSPNQYADTATPVIPDMPGLNMCPDPSTARTHTDFMDTLRMYYKWAGKPSYRAMEKRCEARFAASTIHSALNSNKLPKLAMVQAIITACGGSDEHLNTFASAWRRFEVPQQDAGHPSRPRALYPVSETA